MDDTYGLCLIFVNDGFARHNRLLRSQIIAEECVGKTEGEMFFPLVYENLDSTSIIEKVTNVDSDPEYNSYGKFKYIFITHGGKCSETGQNVIFGSDSMPIAIQRIIDILDYVNTVNLKGKLKLFRFYNCDCNIPANEGELPLVKGVIERDSRNVIKNGIRDTIVMWSTLHGFKAFRSPKKGSRFIRSLCKTIKRFANQKEITEILRIVQTKVDKYAHQENQADVQVTEMQLIGYRKNFYLPPASHIRMHEDYNWCSYEMKNASPGVCLIININTVAINVDERKGSEVDVNNLQNLMKSFNYKVITHVDIPAKKIYEAIEDCLNNNTKDIDSFMLFLMSHGEKSGNSVRIYGSDGLFADVDKIIDLFNEEKCPTLKWKPKFLFFNFCRGETNELFSSESESDLDEDETASDNIRTLKRYKSSKVKPILRDLLVEWRSVNRANMREMIVGTRLTKQILMNLSEIQSRLSDLEVMQLLRTVTIICQKIGVSAGDHVSAIGLRKFLYLFNFDFHRVNPNSYTLNIMKRGISVIIDNFEFDATVTSKHEQYLSMFMRFEIIYMKNLTSEEIKNLITTLIKDERLKNHDAFTLLIKTRMKGRFYLYGSDNTVMSTRKIIEYFNDDNCPFLKGKPKFIRFFNSEQIKYEDRTDEEIRV
ncbi:uncharacterized protein B4U80_13211, partial [Leptotrombidium deliense]